MFRLEYLPFLVRRVILVLLVKRLYAVVFSDTHKFIVRPIPRPKNLGAFQHLLFIFLEKGFGFIRGILFVFTVNPPPFSPSVLSVCESFNRSELAGFAVAPFFYD